MTQIIKVPLDRIRDNPWQPRISYDEAYISGLAENIRQNGLLHPPVGRLMLRGEPLDPDPYGGPLAALGDEPGAIVELSVGHNRVRAYRVLAATDPTYCVIPTQIATCSNETMAKQAWSENFQRKELTPLEEMRAIQRAMADFGWSQRQAAEEFGLNETTISNKLGMLKDLPEQDLEALHRREISERHAAAVLPVYRLPPPALNLAKTSSHWNVTSPSKLIQLAKQGQSSDEIRKAADKTIETVTAQLTKAVFPLDEVIGQGDPGVHGKCTNCPMLVKWDKQKRCGDINCFDLKEKHWRSYRLLSTQQKFNLPLADPNKPRYQMETFSYSSKEAGKAIIEAGCPKGNLRLAYEPERDDGIRVEGFKDVSIVCNSGSRCACLKKWEKTHQRPLNTREREEARITERFNMMVLNPATEAMLKALAVDNVDLWKLVLDEKAEWENAMRVRAENAIRSKGNFYTWTGEMKDLIKARAKVDTLLEPLGVRPNWPPLVDETIADVTRRFERIKGWVGGLNGSTPSPEAVRGNMTNLEKLYEELDQLPGTVGQDLRNQIWDTLGVLTQWSRSLEEVKTS